MMDCQIWKWFARPFNIWMKNILHGHQDVSFHYLLSTAKWMDVGNRSMVVVLRSLCFLKISISIGYVN